MITLLSPHYKAQEVTRGDLVIASTALGFTIGFGWLTVWKACRQSFQIYQRHGRRVFKNGYIIMVWLELLVCTIFAVICILHLLDVIPPRWVFLPRTLGIYWLTILALLSILLFVSNIPTQYRISLTPCSHYMGSSGTNTTAIFRTSQLTVSGPIPPPNHRQSLWYPPHALEKSLPPKDHRGSPHNRR